MALLRLSRVREAFHVTLLPVPVYVRVLPTRVPSRTGDWFYQVTELVTFVLVVIAIVFTFKTFAASYDRRMDSFGGNRYLPSEFASLWIAVPALIIALVSVGG